MSENQIPDIQTNPYVTAVEMLYQKFPFFYDENRIFWKWNHSKYCYEITDEMSLLVIIDKTFALKGKTVITQMKNNYIEAFKFYGRMKIPKEPQSNWIQFGNYVTNIKVGHNWGKDGHDATPEYFYCNPILWNIGKTTDTPVMDKLFTEWVGEEYVQTLYEIIAYCCLPDMPIHLCFCLVGSGRNGKSVFQRLVGKFLGLHNCVSTDLNSIINNRFESFKMYKKLCCQLGETDFGILKQTSLLKKLIGGDLVGFEKKNKDPFDAHNYAKIIINSNSLPTSEDTSEGFYRRWLIIDFPNEFPEGKDILDTVPDIEFNNLARKCIQMLPHLLECGTFSNQGTIEERKNKFIASSNPLPFFIRDFCDEDSADYFVLYNVLFAAYKEYLKKNKKRLVSRKEFSSGMENEGFYFRKMSKTIAGNEEQGLYFEGIKLKKDWKNFFENKVIHTQSVVTSYNFDKSDLLLTLSPRIAPKSEHSQICKKRQDLIQLIKSKISKIPKSLEEIYCNLNKEYPTLHKEFFDDIIKKLKYEGDVFEPSPGLIAKL